MSSERESESGNRLAEENSPYLLQHADNPVDWYPWSEEAFEQARRDSKPIFLSIGYSTCHWCHVMAHESFEDDDIASLMNEAFVNIKVDREERPDIDKAYMKVAQMMTGRGGWPLTIIMTPDKEPFFAGTYIPKNSRYGQIGLSSLIPKIKELWDKDQSNIQEVVARIKSALQRDLQTSGGSLPSERLVTQAVSALGRRYDDERGGFGRAPKFPSPHNMLLLLRHWKNTEEPNALEMAEKTLQEMRRGGIFDQVGKGFHRYSTDNEWLVPHFEKMLYDQAMMMIAYVETYVATGKREYADVVNEITDYVSRELRDERGGFFSAQDADSEGEEGRFYVWEYEEIESLLEPEQMRVFVEAYSIRPDGNFKDESTGKNTGRNIPHLSRGIDGIAEILSKPPEEVTQILHGALSTLFKAREERIKPHLDDKILTDWNALMIAALAMAGRFIDEQYTSLATEATEFVLSHLQREGILLHRYRHGEAGIAGFLDDYVFFTWALIELYQTTFDPDYLKEAIRLQEITIEEFWDQKAGGFYFTGKNSEELITREKNAYDGAIPSGNSIAAFNLIRLSRLTGSTEFESYAEGVFEAFASNLEAAPAGHSMMMAALQYMTGQSLEVVIAGEPDDDRTLDMIQVIRNAYLPQSVVILKGNQKQIKEIDRMAPYARFYNEVDGKPTVHVCIDHNCKLPTHGIEKMRELLRIT